MEDKDLLRLRTKPIRKLSKQLKSVISDMYDYETPQYEEDPFENHS